MSATPAPLYKIANWHALYESRESHRTAGPMKWLPVVTKTDGSVSTFDALCRIDTANELEYFLNGGILHYVLRKLAA